MCVCVCLSAYMHACVNVAYHLKRKEDTMNTFRVSLTLEYMTFSSVKYEWRKRLSGGGLK